MAKVKIVDSSTEFLALIERSGLLKGTELEAARATCTATEDPKTAARKLLADGILTQWQATQLLAGFAGLVMGKYELLDVLAKTQFGRVYLAEHVTMGQKVSLHTLSVKNVADAQLVERFLNEARAASLFEHRNVLRVLDMNSDGDRHFVVIESVAGQDLRQRVEKSGPLPPLEATEFIRQAAEGLAYIHQKNILHRDVKPSSLLVDSRGVIKILDVGMGQLRQVEQPTGDSTGPIPLTRLGFVSPEQARGQELDVRSDIYALGGVLYFVLTGRPPYQATTDEERHAVNEAKRPLPIASLCKDVSAALCELCEQMMALRPDDRPASMAEVVERLQGILKSPLPQPEPQSATDVPAPLAKPLIKQSSGSVPADSSSRFIVPDDETDGDADHQLDNEPIQINIQKKGRASDEPPIAPVDDEPVDLKLQTKAREAKATPAARMSAEEIARKQKTRMLITIAGLAAALLILLTGAIVALMMKGDSTEVAAKSTQAQDEVPDEHAVEVASTSATDAVTAAIVPSVPATAAASSPLASLTASDASTQAATDQPSAVPAVTTPEKAAAEAPAATAPVASSVSPAADPSIPATPGATVAASSTAFGAPSQPSPSVSTSVPVPEAKPETPPVNPPAPPANAATPPTEPAKPQSTSDAKPEGGPATPPPPQAPRFDIASAVELPPLPNGDAAATGQATRVLGNIYLDEKAGCFISLIGGDRAVKGKNEFSLRSARGGTAPRDWEFFTRDSNDEETILANLSLAENKLSFAWTPEGAKNSVSPYLQNCALKVTVGQEKPQIVALRKPVENPPAALTTLERSAVTLKIAIDAMPDPASLRFEPKIADLKLTTDSPASEGSRGDTWLYVGEAGQNSILHLKMATNTTAKGVQVTLTPYLVLPQEKPQRLTPALKKALPAPAALEEEKLRVKKRVEELATLPNEQGKLEIGVMDVRTKNLDDTLAKLKQFDEVMQKLTASQLKMRVYYDATEAQIDLVR